MKFGPVPLDQAEGKILGHNIAAADGRRLLRKGKPLTDDDIAALRALGRTSVYVAELEPGDVGENDAARRIARAIAGPSLTLSGAASGRANLLADALGIARVDADRLSQINEAYRGQRPLREGKPPGARGATALYLGSGGRGK